MQVMMIGSVKGTKEAGLTIGDWLCNEELPCERSGYFTKQLPQIFSVFFIFCEISPWDVASATGEKEIPLAVEQTLHHHSLTVKNIITITITIITITVTA